MNALKLSLHQARTLQSTTFPAQAQPSQLDINTLLGLMLPLMMVIMLTNALSSAFK
jgi:hypothetical protein